ncbi:probable G-protein coupled receptor Mth-like 4 isoform X1 [Spodoptera frugiperda]|uniref:Probable G-protein coupled receptor Mth-like 4 isoform X1 n=1 Tax=Spodoptera frugiperda TaxID=7108 RepID=A0A9R0DP37_SPOFR|nr:probable G-protein coupled receptor Mth-like 4 isoform X1 [Spodoptera frugiperda]
MHLLIVLSAIVYASVDIVQGANVFHKCCPNNHSLMKVFDDESFNFSSYKCLDRESAWNDYNITITPLFVGKNLSVEDGIPETCDDVPIEEVTVLDFDSPLQVFNGCHDRLVAELYNGTVKTVPPSIIGLKSCVKKEDNKTSEDNLIIHKYRKCCPRGQSYDSNFHLCRESEVNNSEEWLLKRLKMNDNDIYEVDTGLDCPADEYGLELRQRFFSLRTEGSTLKIFSKKGDGSGDADEGQWCVDREFSSSELVARVCSSDCSKYGAFCVRKCCPIGYHYKPRRCGSFASKCVPNVDDVLFDISDYMEPLQHKNPEITDVMGFRIHLQCSSGYEMLNQSVERDQHHLKSDGLVSPSWIGDGYCFEAFDNRFCPDGNTFITAVKCDESPTIALQFKISVVFLAISNVFLALTLLVYISVPELRNLHGRNIISHVSMMLLAYCCLARAKHSYVADNTVCTLIGYGIYFGFMAAFAWLNVMCFDIWWKFGSLCSVQPVRKTSSEVRRFLWYSLYAWGITILFTVVMFILDKYPVSDYLDANMGKGYCWFGSSPNSQQDWPHYIFFVIPMGLEISINFVLWVLTARYCAKVKSDMQRFQVGSVDNSVKKRFTADRAMYMLTGKLWILMGVSWIFEILATTISWPRWFWASLGVINELRGVLIFIILVMKPKVYYLIKNMLRGIYHPDSSPALGEARGKLGFFKFTQGAQEDGTSPPATTLSTFPSQANGMGERNNTQLSLQNYAKQS